MAKAETTTGSNPGAALTTAQTLRRLGWPSAAIDKILAGPERSSIHDIAGRSIRAQSMDAVEAVVVPDEEDGNSTSAPKLKAPQIAIGQKEIADAVWASVSEGDPLPLATIARQLKKLSQPLQAYLMAASVEVKEYYKDLATWKRDFDRVQSAAAAQREKERKEAGGTAGTAAGVAAAVAMAAAAANAVPIAGQAVSAALALGLAVATAITEANPLPVRKAEDQVRPGYEGVRVFRGLAVEAPESPYADPYLTLKQAVVQDAVAFNLPAVPPRTRFDFAPRLSAFQDAAHQLGLYSEDGVLT